MEEAADSEAAALPIAKKQTIVYFDVGGKPFKTVPETIDKYPDSRLSKLIAGHPEAVAAEEPLYVDRNPDCFSWILECYRDSHLVEKAPPDLSKEALKRELAFFGLPVTLLPETKEAPPNLLISWACDLFGQIMDKIHKNKTEKMLPLNVCVYDALNDKGPIERRIFVRPNGFLESPSDHDKNHGKFPLFFQGGSYYADRVPEKEFYTLKFGTAPDHERYVLTDLSACGGRFIKALNKEAAKYDLKIEQSYYKAKSPSSRLPYLLLTC